MEIAGQMSTLTCALRDQGVDALSVNYHPSYLDYKNDLEVDFNAIPVNSRPALLRGLFDELRAAFDTFHFHFGTSIVPGNQDLPRLATAGKRVLMHHWGSDVRRLSIAKRYSPDIVVKLLDEDRIRRHLEFLGRYVDCAIISDADLLPHIEEFYDTVKIVPQVLDVRSYPLAAKGIPSGAVVIAHAPTSRDFKGSEHVFAAVDEISRRHPVKFVLIEGLPHDQAMKVYASADIVIDQVLAGSHGLLAVECMAMGKPVVTFINDRMRAEYPADLPLVSADRHSLVDVLDSLVRNRDSLPSIGAAGRTYVEKRHDVSVVLPQLLAIYAGLHGEEPLTWNPVGHSSAPPGPVTDVFD